MKRYLLLLAILLPVISVAQVNDIYFVPTKEKKAVVVKTSEVNSFADIDDGYVAEEPLPVDTVEGETAYFTDNLYGLYDGDYGYSARIIRFRSPDRLWGSSLYWDLRYNSGISDWLVYDNGYSIDIYPTYNNPYFYYAGCGIGFYNPSAWHVYYNGFTPYWAWRPSWYWHDYHWFNNHWYYPHWHHPHWHAGYYPPHYGNNGVLRPRNRVHNDVPVNGEVAKGDRNAAVTNGEAAGNGRGGTAVRTQQRPRRTVNDANVTDDAVTSRDDRGGAADIRRQQPRRETGGTNTQNVADDTRKTGVSGANRQQPQRGTSNANVRENRNDRGGNAVRRSGDSSSSSRNGSTGSYRSGGSSSGSSNRSGNTGVSRTGGSSGSSNRSSGSVGGSSSRGGSSGGSRGGSATRR